MDRTWELLAPAACGAFCFAYTHYFILIYANLRNCGCQLPAALFSDPEKTLYLKPGNCRRQLPAALFLCPPLPSPQTKTPPGFSICKNCVFRVENLGRGCPHSHSFFYALKTRPKVFARNSNAVLGEPGCQGNRRPVTGELAARASPTDS